VPIEYQKELQFRSDRLKDAVRRLQKFSESTASQAGKFQQATTDRSSASPQEMTKAASVIQFPRDRKPARRTKKIKTNYRATRILTMNVR
jgi:hypothetical protein